MKLKELQAKRQKLAKMMKRLGDRQAKWNAEDRGLWDKLNREYDANLAQIQKANAAADRESALRNELEAELDDLRDEERGLTPPSRDGRRQRPSWQNRVGRDGASLADGPLNRRAFGARERQDALRSLAIQGWLRAAHDPARVGNVTREHVEAARACGINLHAHEISFRLHTNYAEVRNALSEQTGGKGGLTFGETFVENLELAMKAYGGMLDVADVIRTTNAEPMRWPTATDINQTGRMIGESAATDNTGTTTAEMTFAQKVWYAYKATSDEILVPFELLRDNAVNLVKVLSEMLGIRLGRIKNTRCTTGTGGGAQPTGIVTAATLGVTAASSTAIAYDELISLEHSIDPARRNLPGVGYMFHDNTLQALRKLKDGIGRYLWMEGSNEGAPDKLNNRPYTINQDMASSIATTNKTVLFGQMTQYKIREVNEIRMYRLVERYRANDQDSFLCFQEFDGNLLDAGDHPVKYLQQA